MCRCPQEVGCCGSTGRYESRRHPLPKIQSPQEVLGPVGAGQIPSSVSQLGRGLPTRGGMELPELPFLEIREHMPAV